MSLVHNSEVLTAKLPVSKSIVLRLKVLESFDSDFLQAQSRFSAIQSACDDSDLMEAALLQLQSNSLDHSSYHCGLSAAVLRFLTLRLSRKPGKYFISGAARLFERPHEPLFSTLRLLGAQVSSLEVVSDGCRGFYLESNGWKYSTSPVFIAASETSQVLSGIFLSAWNLPEPLLIETTALVASRSYLEMTLELVNKLGLCVQVMGNQFLIKPKQEFESKTFKRQSSQWQEIDLTLAFTMACFGALGTGVVIERYPLVSMQAESIFPKILESFGVQTYRLQNVVLDAQTQESSLKVLPLGPLSSQGPTLEIDLSLIPDLFPMLAAFCAFTNRRTLLFGAPHLVHKESNRIDKTKQLLEMLGVPTQQRSDGLEIIGQGLDFKPSTHTQDSLCFDPEQDHRMAMAAALFIKKGFPIKLLNRECVSKSFPNFWKAVGL